MASLDQPAQIFVRLGILLVVMPAGDVNGADAGFAPAIGEVIQIHARAISSVKESPQALAMESRLHAKIVQSLKQIRESLVAFFTRRCGDPQHGTHAAMQSHHDRRMIPTFSGQNTGVLWHIENGNFDWRFPDDFELGGVPIDDASHRHTLGAGRNAKSGREFTFAFHHYNATLLDALDPLWDRSRGDIAHYE
jgi:hypothetical protein